MSQHYLFLLFGLKMILTRDDRNKIEVGKNQILGIVRYHRKFSCGLKPSTVLVILSELMVILSVIEVNILCLSSFFQTQLKETLIFSQVNAFLCLFSVISLSHPPLLSLKKSELLRAHQSTQIELPPSFSLSTLYVKFLFSTSFMRQLQNLLVSSFDTTTF